MNPQAKIISNLLMQARTKILHLIKESHQPRRRNKVNEGPNPKASVMKHRKMGSPRGAIPLTLRRMTLIEHALIFN